MIEGGAIRLIFKSLRDVELFNPHGSSYSRNQAEASQAVSLPVRPVHLSFLDIGLRIDFRSVD